MFESDAIDSLPPRPIVMGLRHEIEAWKDFYILGVNSMKEGLSINIFYCRPIYLEVSSISKDIIFNV
jgi:hypothetical protein